MGRLMHPAGAPGQKQGTSRERRSKRTTVAETKALRAAAMRRCGGVCEWSRCFDPAQEMAHLEHRGLGGSPNGRVDVLDNVAMLCRHHHDILDRRKTAGTRFDMCALLREIIETRHGSNKQGDE